MAYEPNESAFHHKKQITALERERETLENENRVLQLKVQHAKQETKLKEEEPQEESAEEKRHKKRLTDALEDHCIHEMQKYKFDLKENYLSEIKHFVHLYVEREWSLHLKAIHGHDESDADPDEALVHDVIKDFIDYHNTILDTKGAILEKQKGPIGRRDKNYPEWLWNKVANKIVLIGIIAILAVWYSLLFGPLHDNISKWGGYCPIILAFSPPGLFVLCRVGIATNNLRIERKKWAQSTAGVLAIERSTKAKQEAMGKVSAIQESLFEKVGLIIYFDGFVPKAYRIRATKNNADNAEAVADTERNILADKISDLKTEDGQAKTTEESLTRNAAKLNAEFEKIAHSISNFDQKKPPIGVRDSLKYAGDKLKYSRKEAEKAAADKEVIAASKKVKDISHEIEKLDALINSEPLNEDISIQGMKLEPMTSAFVGEFLGVGETRRSKLRRIQEMGGETAGSIAKQDLDYERSYVRIHRTLAQCSRAATFFASLFMVLMLTAALMQLGYSLTFAFHVDSVATHGVKVLEAGLQQRSTKAFDRNHIDLDQYETNPFSYIKSLFYPDDTPQTLLTWSDDNFTLVVSQEHIGNRILTVVDSEGRTLYSRKMPEEVESNNIYSDVTDGLDDFFDNEEYDGPLKDVNFERIGEGITSLIGSFLVIDRIESPTIVWYDAGYKFVVSGIEIDSQGHGDEEGPGEGEDDNDVEEHESTGMLRVYNTSGMLIYEGPLPQGEAIKILSEEIKEKVCRLLTILKMGSSIPHDLHGDDDNEGHSIEGNEVDAPEHPADDSDKDVNINIGLADSGEHGSDEGHADHKGGHSEAMKRALIALEMILLAPLPYLLLVGLSRYIKALVFREQVDEFRRELLDFKSFEVALFIAIIAAAMVSKVLSQELGLTDAFAFAIIIGVLAAYFLVIEWRSGEDAKHELAKEKQDAELEKHDRAYLEFDDRQSKIKSKPPGRTPKRKRFG